MAAAQYTTDLLDITTSDTNTGMSEPTGATSGGLPSVETDYFIQGVSCVSKTFNSTGLGGIAYTGADITVPADGAFYTWIYFAAPNALATKAAGGSQIVVGDTKANYNKYYVSGSDTYTYGGWVNYPVNPNITPSAIQGSPTGTTNTFGHVGNVVNAIAKGNPFAVDAIRYGRGTLTLTGGDLANGYATLAGAAAVNDVLANRWGILSYSDGVFKMQGHLSLGTAATAVDFRDSNKSVIISNTEFVTSTFNLIEIRNAASTAIFDSISVQALGTVARGNLSVVDNAAVTITACSFTDTGTFVFKPNCLIEGNTFRRTLGITHGGCTFTNNTVVNSNSSVAVTTADPSNIQNCDFIAGSSANSAIELTAPGTFSFSNNTFSGYAANGAVNAAITNNSGGLVTLNVSGGTVPTVYNVGGSTTVISAAANVTLTGLKANSEVRAYLGTDPSTATELAGIENSSTSFSFSQSAGGQDGYIIVHALGFVPYILYLTYDSTDSVIPVQQNLDRIYNNP